MSIKLKGSTDGSVSLDAPADTSPTGTDVTFVLPTKDGTGNQVLSTDGSGNLSFADNVSSGRNLVINGAMNVAQRGTSAVTASGAFPVDRFKTSYNVTGGGFSAQQSTDVPEGFKNSVKFTVTTAASAGSSEVSALFVALEGQDIQQADLGLSTCKPLTLSFYVKSSLTGTYSVAMRNSDGSRSYIAEYSISSANTWEQKTVTFPAITSGTWATDETTGLSLTWDLGSGSDRQGTAGSWLSGTNDFASTNNVNWCNTASATWFITGVQLEVGSVGTAFEHRKFSNELAECQRYFEKSYNYSIAPGTASDLGAYVIRKNSALSSITEINFRFSVSKRANPDVVLYSPSTGTEGKIRNVTDSADITASASAVGENACYVVGDSAIDANDMLTAQFTADAELD